VALLRNKRIYEFIRGLSKNALVRLPLLLYFDQGRAVGCGKKGCFVGRKIYLHPDGICGFMGP